MEKIEYWDDRWYKLSFTEEILFSLEELHKKKFPNPLYLVSATTVLNIINKPWLNTWRGDLGNELANFKSWKGKQLGSKIHEAIVQLWTGAELEAEKYTQDEWVQIDRFWKWYQSFQKPRLKTEPELTVYSLQYLYAGTLDFVIELEGRKYNIGYKEPVELEGGLYIGDLKTGKGIDVNYYRQLASYAHAFQEMTQEEVKGAFILHTQADTKQGWKMIKINREELDKHFQAFLHALELWRSENENLTPDIFDMPAKIKLYKEREAI